MDLQSLQNHLSKLMSDFDNSTYRLKLAIEIGGKLDLDEVDFYNFTHGCIVSTRERIKLLGGE